MTRLEAGGWWRFSRYEIANGFIRPAKEAEASSYELWQESEDPPAYGVLANIVLEAGASVATGQLAADIEARLLAWCQRYGLLGLLLQRVESVTFAVRPDGDGGESQPTLRRTPHGWQHLGSGTPTGPFRKAASPGVMLHGINSTEMVLGPVETAWARFFPTLGVDEAETFEYPHPYDEAFWRLYEEPVSEFMQAAAIIAEALRKIADCRGDPKTNFGPLSDYAFALGTLNGCTTSIRMYFSPEPDGTASMQWRAPTLFSSLALRALYDLTREAYPRRCQACKTLFVSTAWQARYCSETCRSRINKRAQRQAQRKRTQRKRSHRR